MELPVSIRGPGKGGSGTPMPHLPCPASLLAHGLLYLLARPRQDVKATLPPPRSSIKTEARCEVSLPTSTPAP